jgi:hypothetical protein
MRRWYFSPTALRRSWISKAAFGSRTWFGRLNLLLALVVVACGVMLMRGRPW